MINGFDWKTMLGAIAVIGALAWCTAPGKAHYTEQPSTHNLMHSISEAKVELPCTKNKLAQPFVESQKGKELLVVPEKDISVFHKTVFGQDVEGVRHARVYKFRNIVRIVGFRAEGECVVAWVDVYQKSWEVIKAKYLAALRDT